MEIGETTSGIVTTTSDNEDKAIQVPSGEVWRFTNLSGEPSPFGVYDGSTYYTGLYRTDNKIMIGSYSSNDAGARTLVVDGDKHDLAIRPNNGASIHWSATRVA